MHFTKKNAGEKRKDFVNNLKEKKLLILITGIGMALKSVGVFQAKTIKFQLSFSMDLAQVENIGGTI